MTSTPGKPPTVVFRLGHMGDVALTTGVLARRHEAEADSFIFVTREANGPLLENHPAVAEVVALSSQQVKEWSRTAAALADEYRGRDLVDLHGTLRSRLLSLRWKGAVKRYPKFGLARRLYDRTRLDLFRKRLEATTVPQRYALAFEDAPPPARDVLPRIFLTDAERKAAAERLARFSADAPLVALHPYATHPAKEWPRDHWKALAGLLDAAGIGWFVVGRSNAPLMPGDPRDQTNATDLRETCGLLDRADRLVTGDSGPMHLACGVSTPVTALFGPTARAWGFYPAGPRDEVLEMDLDCRPCSLHGKKPCRKGFECMASLTPENVMQAVADRLNV
ncbi:MAG: glycosyltransferase family 9 protein [Desulfovibrionaceae bacterium]|nr:glycosyltransferase family 9 protein [Desulfovibrionaceae bacterium]